MCISLIRNVNVKHRIEHKVMGWIVFCPENIVYFMYYLIITNYNMRNIYLLISLEIERRLTAEYCDYF